MKPFTLLRYIDDKELKQLASRYYPKGLKTKMTREQLMAAINGSIITRVKNPMLEYLNHINHKTVKTNTELGKLIKQVVVSSNSIEVRKRAQELLSGSSDIKHDDKEVTYVYLIQELITNSIKIGYTNDPNRRFTEFKVQLPFEIKHLHTIECAKGRETENLLHKHYHHKRLSGEWFRLTERDVDDIKNLRLPKKIVAMITRVGVDPYLNKQKTKKLNNKITKKTVKKDSVNKPIFDDDDYLIYEDGYDEFRRDLSIVSFDERIHY